MAACERCWAEFSRRSLYEGSLTYSEVVAQTEASGRVCTPAEQCGDLHITLEMKDGGKRCRCGMVVERAAEGRKP
jgi:hypothetical protein